ncbi:MAG: hypothetical protein ACOCS7_00255 [Halolamina sp.]
MTAIESVGVHVPRYRIQAETIRDARGSFEPAGVETVAVPGADEDALTMGVEAAERALDGAGVDRSSIETLTIGTTTPPLDEGDLTAQTVALLGLEQSVETTAVTQSTRAGTRAVRIAERLRDGPALAIAADAPRGPPDDALGQGAGAGAVALLLTDDGSAAIETTAATARAYPGTRYRERGRETTRAYGATSYERRAYAESVARTVDALEEPVVALAPTAPDGSMPYRATTELDDDPPVYQAASSLGDTGAASPLFGLLEAWNEGETDVAVVGYGGGSIDVIRVEGTASPRRSPVPTVDLSYARYLELRGEIADAGGEA